MDPTTDNNLDAKDQNGASSSPDAKPSPAAVSSPAADANQAKPVKDFAELAMEAFNAQNKPAVSSAVVEPAPVVDAATAAAAEGDINKSNQTAEPPSTETAKPDAAPVKDKDEDLPFHKHVRFQELKKERDDFKTATEAAKPQVERMAAIDQFMSSNHISFDQFKTALEIQALINNAPEQALDRLQPLITHLQGFKGEILPPDLKTEVDSGTLPLARAQEIAKLRKQSQFKEQQSQQTSRDTNAERLMTALSTWEDSARRTDPDYERKKNFVLNRFVALSASQPWQTAEQAVALAKQAYTEVNTELGTFVPKPRPSKLPPANGHSAAVKPAFTTWNQAEDFAADVIRRRR